MVDALVSCFPTESTARWLSAGSIATDDPRARLDFTDLVSVKDRGGRGRLGGYENRDPRIEFEANSTSCPLSHSRVDDLAVCVESPCLAVCAESAATPSQSERGLRQDGCFVEPQEPEPLDLAHGLLHVRRRARVNLPPPSFGLLQVPLGLPKPAAAPLEFPKQTIHLLVVTHLADGPLDRHTARPRTRPGPRRRRRRSRS